MYNYTIDTIACFIRIPLMCPSNDLNHRRHQFELYPICQKKKKCNKKFCYLNRRKSNGLIQTYPCNELQSRPSLHRWCCNRKSMFSKIVWNTGMAHLCYVWPGIHPRFEKKLAHDWLQNVKIELELMTMWYFELG